MIPFKNLIFRWIKLSRLLPRFEISKIVCNHLFCLINYLGHFQYILCLYIKCNSGKSRAFIFKKFSTVKPHGVNMCDGQLSTTKQSTLEGDVIKGVYKIINYMIK